MIKRPFRKTEKAQHKPFGIMRFLSSAGGFPLRNALWVFHLLSADG